MDDLPYRTRKSSGMPGRISHVRNVSPRSRCDASSSAALRSSYPASVLPRAAMTLWKAERKLSGPHKSSKAQPEIEGRPVTCGNAFRARDSSWWHKHASIRRNAKGRVIAVQQGLYHAGALVQPARLGGNDQTKQSCAAAHQNLLFRLRADAPPKPGSRKLELGELKRGFVRYSLCERSRIEQHPIGKGKFLPRYFRRIQPAIDRSDSTMCGTTFTLDAGPKKSWYACMVEERRSAAVRACCGSRGWNVQKLTAPRGAFMICSW